MFDFRRACFRTCAGKPGDSFLEIIECLDAPATQLGDERKQPGAMVRVGTVKHRQPLTVRETDFAERVHQHREIVRGEHGLRPRMQRPQIQQRLVDSAFAARAGQFRQRRLAGFQVKFSVRAKTDEFMGANDLKFHWHRQGIVNRPVFGKPQSLSLSSMITAWVLCILFIQFANTITPDHLNRLLPFREGISTTDEHR